MQTSIQWLEQQIDEKIELLKSDWYILDKLFEQAKEIHKHEIIDAWDNGNADYMIDFGNGEEYYSEIFKKD